MVHRFAGGRSKPGAGAAQGRCCLPCCCVLPEHGQGRCAPGGGAIEQTRSVLRACRDAGSPRLVYTSSLSTIGRPPVGEDRLSDECDVYQAGTLPRSAYYECKSAMEAEVLRAAAAGSPAVVVNPTVVFGPGDARPTTGALLLALARGAGLISLPGWLNVVDVRDVAAAHLAAAEAGALGERYILGGHNLRIAEFMRSAALAAGARTPWFELPRPVLRVLVRTGERLPGLSVLGNHLGAFESWQPLDSRKAVKHLGLHARPWSETLRDSLDWYRRHGALGPATPVV
ncbi:MAG: NAD-dependent epimerase/dehydratase family protein [Chloroflexi bacterium]|nr:NAD-dependent epimerase/dehydratase family protein [Chloroflexota bacterium]